MIRENFLPDLFFGKSKYPSPIKGTINKMLVKKYGLGLLNPMTSVNKECLSLQCASTELIQDGTGEGEFSNADHLLALKEERSNRNKNRDDVIGVNLKELVSDLDSTKVVLSYTPKTQVPG